MALNDHIHTAHLLSSNAEQSMFEGESIHVGVVDSVLPDADRFDGSTFRIERREDFVAPDEEDTSGHGSRVFDTLQFCSPESSFSFYRVIVKDPERETGVAKRSNVVEAIDTAARDGVDILNLSLGICHAEEDGHDCGELCRIADGARLAIEEEELTIIAATGNDWNADAVTCPALVSRVIGVGGYASVCTNDLDTSGQSSQYWVDAGQLYGPFCGQRGCQSEACDAYRSHVPWENNVSFHTRLPIFWRLSFGRLGGLTGRRSNPERVMLHGSSRGG